MNCHSKFTRRHIDMSYVIKLEKVVYFYMILLTLTYIMACGARNSAYDTILYYISFVECYSNFMYAYP